MRETTRPDATVVAWKSLISILRDRRVDHQIVSDVTVGRGLRGTEIEIVIGIVTGRGSHARVADLDVEGKNHNIDHEFINTKCRC